MATDSRVQVRTEVLLSDWEGAEVWGTIFDELAKQVLGFIANTCTGMTSDADRYALVSAAGSPCHGHY